MNYPQEYDCDQPLVIILDDLNEKETSDSPVQARFKRSRHNNISISIISQDYYEFQERTIRAKGNIYHIFKPNNYRYNQNLYQEKTSRNMKLNEFKLLTSTSWIEQYQPLTVDKTKDKYCGRYRLRLDTLFVRLNEYLS